MDHNVHLNRLLSYIKCPVKVSIQGEQDEEQAPLFRKKLIQVVPCIEGKHLKFYFDSHTFVAVPLECNTWWEGEQFIAYDEDKKLKYVFLFTVAEKV